MSAPPQFLFSSPHRSLRASGVAQRIALPVQPEGQDATCFQAAVDQAFAGARAAGIDRPVLMGAIPFDLRRPAALAVPLSHQFFEQDVVMMPPPLAQSPQVLAARSYPEQQRFQQGVRQAMANFQHSDIRKAVLSRMLEVELDRPADVEHILARLRAQNPGAYQFRLPLFDGSELVGASPELLVRKEGDRVFTNPLAGSARRLADPRLDREAGELLTRSDKDRYEHRLVIEDIQRVLAPLCAQLEVPAEPSLIGTAAMWHLSTRIDGVLAQAGTSALEVACRLHPTPAVCGHPTALARKLIELVEPYERGMYAGLVGWCDEEGNGEWAVTIRCGRIHGNRVQLFAGAGIVSESCPQSEWLETQAKLQTMLNALDLTMPRQAREAA